MQGGVDLEKASSLAKAFPTFSTAGLSLVKQVKTLREQVGEKQKEIARLIELEQAGVGKQETIKALKQQLQAKERMQLLHQCKQAQGELATLSQQKLLFDERLELVDPHSLRDAESRKEEAESAEQSLKKLRDELASCESDLLGLAVPQALLDDATIPELLANQLALLAKAQLNLEQAKKDETEKRSELNDWEEQYSWLISQTPEPNTLKEKLQTLGQLARDVEKLRCRLASAQQVARDLGEVEQSDDMLLENLRSLKSELIRLLAAYDQNKAHSSRRQRIVVLATLAISLVSLLLAVFVHPLFALGSTLALIALAVVKSGPAKAAMQSPQLDTLLHKLGYPSGNPQDLQALAEFTATVLQDLATNERIAESNRIRKQAVQTRSEAEQAYQGWKDAWAEASKALYLSDSPALEGAPFFPVAERLKEWHAALVAHHGSLAVLKEAEEHYEAELEKLRALCGTEQKERERLVSHAQTLIKHIEQSHSLLRNREKLQSRIEEQQEQTSKKQDSYQALFEKLGLEYNDLATLTQLVTSLADYQELKNKEKLVQLRLKTYEEEIQAEAKGMTLESIIAQLDRFEPMQKELDAMNAELAGERAIIKRAKNDAQLEQVELSYALKRSELEERREEEVESRMVHLLLSQVRGQTERSFQPEVLRRSSDWLARITSQRYTLSVGPKGFAAYDTILQQSFSLDELSSGTKVQLLFAVRMAFLEMQEASSGYRFPVFFDEVMANSDDERSLAIARAIAEISRNRQVFYCTAQADEVDKLTKEAGDLVHVIDLEDARKGHALQRHPFIAPKSTLQSLPPFTEDYNQYAKLCRVSSPALHGRVGELSSWYLCSSSKELEALLSRGLSTCGQAKEVDERYQRRFGLLEHTQRLARIGRPKVLSVADLADERLKLNRSAAFYEGLLLYVDEAERDGNDILKAIDEKVLSRFSKTAREALESFLLEQDFATNENPLSPKQILSELSLDNPELRIDSEEYLICVRYLECLGFEN
ncbi:hypothetical protein SDC9_64776 [bioreactor metagenome]|uniref:Uncharacterized protein n=1 Tax=bioreactor metagenome TaxID=1076179 RepID=A0A644XR35_9ZZZZ